MRKLVMAFSFVLLFLVTSCSVNQAFVDAVNDSWKVIGPEYEAYVQADPNLSQGEKDTKLLTAQTLTQLIAEAKD